MIDGGDKPVRFRPAGRLLMQEVADAPAWITVRRGRHARRGLFCPERPVGGCLADPARPVPHWNASRRRYSAERTKCSRIVTQRAGRRLSIHFAVMPALRRSAEPDPLFILAGGPGQGARGYAPAAVARYFKAIRRTRAIVLVDLRGTGASGMLTCGREADELAQLAGPFLDASQAARAAGNVSMPTRATIRTPTHSQTLMRFGSRLGYERINLWGGSWGSRAALLYSMTYPQSVRSVVLDGAVPMSLEFPRTTATSAERAFGMLLNACSADAACATTHANARQEFTALLERLAGAATLATRTLVKNHPRTGAPATVTLTRDTVAEIIRVGFVHAWRMLRGSFKSFVTPPLGETSDHYWRKAPARSASWSVDDMAVGQTL